MSNIKCTNNKYYASIQKRNSDFGRQMAVNIFDLHQMAAPLITCTVPNNK